MDLAPPMDSTRTGLSSVFRLRPAVVMVGPGARVLVRGADEQPVVSARAAWIEQVVSDDLASLRLTLADGRELEGRGGEVLRGFDDVDRDDALDEAASERIAAVIAARTGSPG